jgi:hypothetical protein
MSFNTELRHTEILACELGPFPEHSTIYRKVFPSEKSLPARANERHSQWKTT